MAGNFMNQNRLQHSIFYFIYNACANYIKAITSIISFCDFGDKLVTFLAFGWCKCACNIESFSANTFKSAKKLPGLLCKATVSISPHNGRPCLYKKVIAHTI